MRAAQRLPGFRIDRIAAFVAARALSARARQNAGRPAAPGGAERDGWPLDAWLHRGRWTPLRGWSVASGGRRRQAMSRQPTRSSKAVIQAGRAQGQGVQRAGGSGWQRLSGHGYRSSSYHVRVPQQLALCGMSVPDANKCVCKVHRNGFVNARLCHSPSVRNRPHRRDRSRKQSDREDAGNTRQTPRVRNECPLPTCSHRDEAPGTRAAEHNLALSPFAPRSKSTS